MPGVLTLIRTLEERGFTVEAAGDKVRVKPPTPAAIEEARPLLDELRQRKAEVLAALCGCPACGIPADVAEVARKRMRLDAALQACEEHKQGCRECDPGRLRFCPDMETLRERYFTAWQAYHGLPAARWNVSEGIMVCAR